MLIDAITDDSIRDALTRLRSAKPLCGSPLIGLSLLDHEDLPADLREIASARAHVLGQVLDRICGEQLANARGLEPPQLASLVDPEGSIEALQCDFASDHIDREAWGLLKYRYFDPGRASLLELSRRLGRSRRTLRRRIDRGHLLLAECLRERELQCTPRVPTMTVSSTAGRAPAAVQQPPEDSFVDREEEHRKVQALLDRHRLVCLTGPPGVGKSRLAIEVMRHHPYECLCFELDDIRPSEPLATGLARQIGLDPDANADPLIAVTPRLGDARRLLLVDGCERHAQEIASLIERLLDGCPSLTVLATSTTVLTDLGGGSLELCPLPVDELNHELDLEAALASPALRLLVDRLRASRPDLRLSDADVPALCRICRQVDGLPLALELAAARGAVDSLAIIAAGIGKHLDLVDPDRSDPTGTGALRAAIEWSHDALSPPARQLFARLGVFAGSFSIRDVQGVCSDEGAESPGIAGHGIQSLLAELCRHSMLDRRSKQHRQRLLASLARFSREQLEAIGERDAWRARHLQYFLERAGRVADRLDGEDQGQAIAELSLMRADCLKALEYSVRQGTAEPALRMARLLSECWRVQGPYDEGRYWIDRALSVPGGPLALRSALLKRAGEITMLQGDLENSQLRYEAALALADALHDRSEQAAILRRLGNLADERGDLESAGRYYRGAQQLYREIDDVWGMAATQNNLGLVAMHAGRYDEAQEAFRDSLECFGALDENWAVGIVQFNLGNCAFDQQQFLAAREHYHAGLRIAEQLGDAVGKATALRALGNLAAGLGDYVVARCRLRQALDRFGRLEDRKRVAETLESMAEVEQLDGRSAVAVRFLGMANRLRADIGVPVKPKDRRHFDELLDELRKAVESEVFDQVWQAGSDAHWRTLLRDRLDRSEV